MTKYLGEMEEEDLIMFVIEHLKDHKGPQKLVEGLEPVCSLIVAILFLLTLFEIDRSWKKRQLNSFSMSGDKSSLRAWLMMKVFSQKGCSLTSIRGWGEWGSLLLKGAQVRYVALGILFC